MNRELEHFSRQARYELTRSQLTQQDVLYLKTCLNSVKTAILPLL